MNQTCVEIRVSVVYHLTEIDIGLPRRKLVLVILMEDNLLGNSGPTCSWLINLYKFLVYRRYF